MTCAKKFYKQNYSPILLDFSYSQIISVRLCVLYEVILRYEIMLHIMSNQLSHGYLPVYLLRPL